MSYMSDVYDVAEAIDALNDEEDACVEAMLISLEDADVIQWECDTVPFAQRAYYCDEE